MFWRCVQYEGRKTMKKAKTMFASIFGAMLLVVMLAGCPCNPPETAPYVEVERYMGKWYEIAKYPVLFERGLVGVTAEYSLRDDGTVRVVNKGFRGDFNGRETSIEGKAVIADRTTNAKLTVWFGPIPLGFLEPNYWIVGLGGDYDYAVVSDGCRGTLWILSRTPRMDPAKYNMIVSWLEDSGFDTSRLELMPQPE